MPITKATASSIAPAAKGDLVVGSATNDAAVLGVGSNDQVLTADSSTATGLKWAAAGGGGTTLINTGGTSLTGSSVTVSSIPTTYSSLIVIAKDVYVSAAAGIKFQMNSDTGNNYYNGNTAEGFWGNLSSAGTNSAVGYLSYYQITLPQYTQTSGRQIGFTLGRGGFQNTYDSSMRWYTKSAAITSVTLLTYNDNFSGGTLWVYGVS